ncbi:MAG: hypothetical protein IJO57_00920 [Bacilli bacterium]|nr:hypothetical protein [Bacilli bacterium]
MLSKKSVIAVLMMILSFGIISIYSTYAFDEEDITLDESNSDYNVMFVLGERDATLVPGETKFIDVSLTNNNSGDVRYGMYYYAINPNRLPSEVNISLADDSDDPLEDIIKINESKSVSIRIENNSEYNINLRIGAFGGFVKDDIEYFETDNYVLIK